MLVENSRLFIILVPLYLKGLIVILTTMAPYPAHLTMMAVRILTRYQNLQSRYIPNDTSCK